MDACRTCKQKDGLIRMELIQLVENGEIKIICADNGNGIDQAHAERLCRNVFASDKKGNTIGQFGIGLKAAALYCSAVQAGENEKHCLKITTSTSHSNMVQCYQFYIQKDDKLANTKVTSYCNVDSVKKHYSGTQVQLLFPSTSTKQLLEAMSTLEYYLRALAYTIPGSLRLEMYMRKPYLLEDVVLFTINDVNQQKINMDYKFHHDKFKFECNADHYIETKFKQMKCHLGILANTTNTKVSTLKVHILRYANHIPLLIDQDIYSDSIFQGIQNSLQALLPKYGGWKIAANENIYTPIVYTNIQSECSYKLYFALNLQCTQTRVPFKSLAKTSIQCDHVFTMATRCTNLIIQKIAKIYPNDFETRSAKLKADLANVHIPQLAKACAEIAPKLYIQGKSISLVQNRIESLLIQKLRKSYNVSSSAKNERHSIDFILDDEERI